MNRLSLEQRFQFWTHQRHHRSIFFFEMRKELPLRLMVWDIDTCSIHFCFQKCRSLTSTPHTSTKALNLLKRQFGEMLFQEMVLSIGLQDLVI